MSHRDNLPFQEEILLSKGEIYKKRKEILA
jgi:hypothetical protein